MALILVIASKAGNGTFPSRNLSNMAYTQLPHQADLKQGYNFCPLNRLSSWAVETDHLPADPKSFKLSRFTVKHQHKTSFGKEVHMARGCCLELQKHWHTEWDLQWKDLHFSAWEMLFMPAASPTLIMILKAWLLPPWFSFLQGMRKFTLQRGIHGGTHSLPGMQGEVLHLADCPVSSELNRAGREPWPGREPWDVHLHWKAESMAGSSITVSFFIPIYSLPVLIWDD